MKTEIEAASSWWTQQLPNHILSTNQSQLFRTHLVHELEQRCSSHWYLDAPLRGSAYRSVIHDARLDPSLESAARIAGIEKHLLYNSFPRGVMWLNPGEVKIRFNGMSTDCSMLIYSSNSSSNNNSSASASPKVSARGNSPTTTIASSSPNSPDASSTVILSSSPESNLTVSSRPTMRTAVAATPARDDDSSSPPSSLSNSPTPSLNSPTIPSSTHLTSGFL